MQKIRINHIKSISVLLATLMLFSCSKNIEEIHELYKKNEDIPISETKNIHLSYTLKGEKVLDLTAPLMLDYSNNKNIQYQYFPNSLHIKLINKKTGEITKVTADKAYIYKNPDLSELIGNVVINGSNNSSLQTSHLYWDSKNNHIFGEEKTIIKQNSERIEGVGFDSSLDFKNIRINQINGDLKINNPPKKQS
jgi:LPS export ABC transporter protein LptC